MRTLLISLAAAASALALASPASAQYYPYPPQPQPYGYGGAPYGQAYGYHNNWGQVRSLQVRIDNLQRQIAQLDARDRISEREARRLREDARNLERRLRVAARNGLHPAERSQIEYRLARLEQRLFRDARDGRRWGWNDGRYDRDHERWHDRNDRRGDRHRDRDHDDD